MPTPRIIDFIQTGEIENGFISVASVEENIPFGIKRVYWIYGTHPNQIRGNHAHKKGDQVLICLSGETSIDLESANGQLNSFILNKPNQGLLVPALYWLKIKIIQPSTLLCISAEEFDENNYIRDYKAFKS